MNTYTVAVRDSRGNRVLMRVPAENERQARNTAVVELVMNPPFMRPRTVLVGIPGGRA